MKETYAMSNDSPLNKSLDDLLRDVQGLTTVGSDRQVRSILAVLAKCTVQLQDGMASTTKEVAAFNASTTALSKQLIRLNRVLVCATVVAAVATLAGSIAAVLALVRC
jgi:hypothetical protein